MSEDYDILFDGAFDQDEEEDLIDFHEGVYDNGMFIPPTPITKLPKSADKSIVLFICAHSSYLADKFDSKRVYWHSTVPHRHLINDSYVEKHFNQLRNLYNKYSTTNDAVNFHQSVLNEYCATVGGEYIEYKNDPDNFVLLSKALGDFVDWMEDYFFKDRGDDDYFVFYNKNVEGKMQEYRERIMFMQEELMYDPPISRKKLIYHEFYVLVQEICKLLQRKDSKIPFIVSTDPVYNKTYETYNHLKSMINDTYLELRRLNSFDHLPQNTRMKTRPCNRFMKLNKDKIYYFFGGPGSDLPHGVYSAYHENGTWSDFRMMKMEDLLRTSLHPEDVDVDKILNHFRDEQEIRLSVIVSALKNSGFKHIYIFDFGCNVKYVRGTEYHSADKDSASTLAGSLETTLSSSSNSRAWSWLEDDPPLSAPPPAHPPPADPPKKRNREERTNTRTTRKKKKK
jgi:hypothetical protein